VAAAVATFTRPHPNTHAPPHPTPPTHTHTPGVRAAAAMAAPHQAMQQRGGGKLKAVTTDATTSRPPLTSTWPIAAGRLSCCLPPCIGKIVQAHENRVCVHKQQCATLQAASYAHCLAPASIQSSSMLMKFGSVLTNNNVQLFRPPLMHNEWPPASIRSSRHMVCVCVQQLRPHPTRTICTLAVIDLATGKLARTTWWHCVH